MLHFMLIQYLSFILSPLGSLVSTAIQFYQQLKHLAKQSNHRQLCCFQGSQQWCVEQASDIIEFENVDYKWCGDSPTSINSCTYPALLGLDIRLLILNMNPQFDANMFAAAEGAVCGGCIIILLLPESIIASDNFTNYILQQLIAHQFPIFKENQQQLMSNAPIVNSPPTSHLYNQPYSYKQKPPLNNKEQQQAIEQIIKTLTGHRRRPLVITANRGRGKSAALGIAAATLINQGLTKIIICAPSQHAVTTLYKHATLTLNNVQDLKCIQFMAPDALQLEQTNCDLLIIDEAAAIPIKLLIEFTKRYSRLVFATTQFGYEGSGRGFTLRFQKQLDKIAPEWRSFHLNQPIRWAENDPVETFTLCSLCLMEQTPNFTFDYQQLQPTISILNREELLQQPQRLNQLFSLLVNAHYQTKPSDLVSLLNDQDLSIISMQHNQEILAVALINHEGGFEQATSEQIYQGKRRPNGHLIAQSFTFHSGFKNAATQRYARIQRIAVQPSLQKQQFGSQLLTWIIDWAAQQQFDHISASFAGSDCLLRFWTRQQLQVLRIGSRKDKSSGQHSLMVNLPLSQQGKELHHQIQTDFHKQVKVQLSRQLSRLDSSLLIALWPQITFKQCNKLIQQSLSAYINANRSYENIEYLLIELLYSSSLEALNCKQQSCLIEKIIQNHSWQEIVQQHHFTGQKQAQAFLKNCICDLLTQPNIDKENTHHNET